MNTNLKIFFRGWISNWFYVKQKRAKNIFQEAQRAWIYWFWGNEKIIFLHCFMGILLLLPLLLGLCHQFFQSITIFVWMLYHRCDLEESFQVNFNYSNWNKIPTENKFVELIWSGETEMQTFYRVVVVFAWQLSLLCDSTRSTLFHDSLVIRLLCCVLYGVLSSSSTSLSEKDEECKRKSDCASMFRNVPYC